MSDRETAAEARALLEATRETAGEHIRNALQIVRDTDARTLGIDELASRLHSVDVRLTAAAICLRLP